MPTRHQTSFTRASGAAGLTGSSAPGVGFVEGSSQWNGFCSILSAFEARAVGATATLTAAAAANAGLLPYADLVPLNEAASDLGFIEDEMRALTARLNLPVMSNWAKRTAATSAVVDPQLVLAKAAAAALAAQNPTFDIAQLQ